MNGLKIILPLEVYIILFINSLSATYPVWADRQRSLARDEAHAPTLDNLMEDIADESRSSLIDSQAAIKGTGVVLYTGKDTRKKAQNKGRGKKEKSEEKCSYCKRSGYSQDSC